MGVKKFASEKLGEFTISNRNTTPHIKASRCGTIELDYKIGSRLPAPNEYLVIPPTGKLLRVTEEPKILPIKKVLKVKVHNISPIFQCEITNEATVILFTKLN